MTLQRSHRNHPGTRAALSAVAGISFSLLLPGCGSGIGTALPGVTQPTAPQGAPSGPVLGYIFSPTDGTLRAMLGVRGSAQMSSSVVPSGVYVSGEASTASSTALLIDAAGVLYAFNLPQSQPTRVADGFSVTSQIVFAPSGKTAVVFTPGGSGLSVISGLPATPQSRSVNFTAASPLLSAVISDAGTVAAATQTSIGVLPNSGLFASFATVKAFGGFNFVPGADDLILADATANAVSLIRNVSTSPSNQALPVAGLNRPVAIAASQDRKWAVIANGGDAGIVRVDLSTGASAAKILCSCQPAQLHALAGGNTFGVNSLYSGPLWTVDVTPSIPQLLFVPAISKGTP